MKTKYLAILLCAAFVLPGCNDSFLDRIPLDELTDETYWETEEHLILASNACINYLRGKSRSVDMEFLGDNVFRERSSEYKTLGSGNFTSDLSVINSEWTTDYDGIRRCNHFLENYERAQKVSASVRERYAGEAIFIRAYLYSYLVNCFGDVPRVTNTIDVGDDELYGSRTDKETMIEWILDEFDRVIGLSRLKAVHLNDSINGLGSHKDRHAKIGEGQIGLDALVNVVCHPALEGIPFILETPNDDEGWKREISLLRERYSMKGD